jgi:hypothetical protein
MKKCLFISTLILLIIIGCSKKATICGVAVKGTPWELAAAIAEKGDGSFVVEHVEVYEQKAYINGWLDTNCTASPERESPYDDGLIPAEIICDIQNGKVSDAFIYCKFLDRE